MPSFSDPLFETQHRTILNIWDRMQRLQTDFAIAQELSFYYASTQWHRAKNVLDVGTGNGYYLGQIARRFPNKNYHGVDSSGELIAIAESETSCGSISFSPRNLFGVTEAYDFVLMRLLLQHTDNVGSILSHIAQLTSPGSSAFIIDACDPMRFFYPDLIEFRNLFEAYKENESRGGRTRDVMGQLKCATESNTAWKIGSTLQLLIPSTIKDNLTLFTTTYMLLIDLIECVGEVKHDFEAVREAWRRWSTDPYAYTQVGLNLIRIDRV